jgi:glycyl-tRNA synthetase beta subunit
MNDALERLKKRNRPTVPNRDASLTPIAPNSASQDISTSSNLDLKISSIQEAQVSPCLEPEQPLKTKQTTLRLEQGISDRLQTLCRGNGICREALIEAMFDHSEANPETLQKILSEARNKNEQRQQLANLKRAKSMMERFGSLG